MPRPAAGTAPPVEGVHLLTPAVHADERGEFFEWLRTDRLARAVGRPVTVAQVNVSVSRLGVLRGIHYAAAPPGQAKFLTCLRGAVLDVVVDVRVGSPTFGRCTTVRLDDRTRRGIWIAAGLGHAVLALSDHALVAYACSHPYAPEGERGLNPLDPDLGIDWPAGLTPRLAPRDTAWPTLAEARAGGLLPRYEDFAP